MKGPLEEDTEALGPPGVITINSSAASARLFKDVSLAGSIGGGRVQEKEFGKPAKPAQPALAKPDAKAAPTDVKKTTDDLRHVPPNLTNIPSVIFDIVLSGLTAAEIVRVTTSVSKTLRDSEERSGSAERAAEVALRSIVKRSWSRLDEFSAGQQLLGDGENFQQICDGTSLVHAPHLPDGNFVETIRRNRRGCEFLICEDESLLRTYYLHNVLYQRAMRVGAKELRVMEDEEMHRDDDDDDDDDDNGHAGENSNNTSDLDLNRLDALVVAPLTWLILGVPILPPLTRIQFQILSVSSHLIYLIVSWDDLAERHADDPDPSPAYLRAVRQAALSTHSTARIHLIADRMRRVGRWEDCQQLCNVLLYGHRSPIDVCTSTTPSYYHDEYFLGHDVIVNLEGSSPLHGRRGTVHALFKRGVIGVRLLPKEAEDGKSNFLGTFENIVYLKPSQVVRLIPDRRLELDLIICSTMAANADTDIVAERTPNNHVCARNVYLLGDRIGALLRSINGYEVVDGQMSVRTHNSCVIYRNDEERLLFAYYALRTSLVQHGYAIGRGGCEPGLHGVFPKGLPVEVLFATSSPAVIYSVLADGFLKDAQSMAVSMDAVLNECGTTKYHAMLADVIESKLHAAAGFLSRIIPSPMLIQSLRPHEHEPRLIAYYHLKVAAEKLRFLFEVTIEKLCRAQSTRRGVEATRPSLDIICQSSDSLIVTSVATIAHDLYSLYRSASAVFEISPFKKPNECMDRKEFLRLSAALSLRSLGRGHPLTVRRMELLMKMRAAQCQVSTSSSGQVYCTFPNRGLVQLEETVNKWLGNYDYDRFLYSNEYFQKIDNSGNASLS